MADQLAETNCTRIKHLSLSATAIVPKEILIGSARLGDILSRMLIKRALPFIDGDKVIRNSPLILGKLVRK